MKAKKILIGLLFLTQTVFGQGTDGISLGKAQTKNYFEEISFEFIKNKIIIPVEINGNIYRFLLDTGAPNMISTALYQEVNPSFIKQISMTDINKKTDTLDVVSLDKLKIGNTIFEKVLSVVNSNIIFDCFKLDGIIGSSMLRNSIIQIDLNKKLIRLTNNRKKLSLNRKNSVKLELHGQQKDPWIWIELTGEKKAKEPVLIDTGMGDLYSISLDNYEIYKPENIINTLNLGKGASTMGFGGEAPAKNHVRVHIPQIKIGNVVFENFVTHTSNTGHSSIGAEVLKYGVMTIDFKNKRFYYEATEKQINLHEELFGITPTFKENKLVIGFVWDEELKGKISYGDEILKINGVDLSELDMCDLLTGKYTFGEEKIIEIEVRSSDGRISTLRIEKHRQ